MYSLKEALAYWIAATRLPGIGPVKFRHWMNHFADVQAFFAAPVTTLQALGLTAEQIRAVQHPAWQAIERDLSWREKSSCHIISIVDPWYPILLKEVVGAPLVLYIKGQLEVLSQPQLAMVGSRNPTVGGRELAEKFAYCLAQAGLVVTSGLALGIDAASHRGALNAGGKTIAVAGNGLHHVYPATHRGLVADIIQAGAYISEFSPEMPPAAANFPRRNRIISGLSLGVLVVEAALRSGSLITARNAIEQGREVFAIPGSIHNPLARGCHQLIQQGAKLVESADQIWEEIGALGQVAIANQPQSKKKNLDQKQCDMLSYIGHDLASLDTLIVRSRLTAGEVSSILLSLELGGHVHLMSGGYTRSS